jgi:phosphoribosyl-ATP pyrophosphohydrolase/phosphoribosyl-AMP cyclohydrolase/histidinol dehydrogenase
VQPLTPFITSALLELSVKFGDLKSVNDDYIWGKDKLKAAYDGLPKEQQELLQRTAARIKAFALAQRASVTEVTVNVPGGQCGQYIAPVECAGCYAPGGRYPLPSSVLMTAATAFAAGVKQVVLASPKPSPVTAAAAYVAGADSLLVCGGAQAIAAMAFGVGKVPACDVIVGPGNRFVTAAKKLVSGRVGIDMLAGPSELLVLADHTANPATVAADLLAQAEHDTLALPLLVTTDESLVAKVEAELTKQLAVLPTAPTASVSLASGYVVVCKDMASAIDITNRLAPEHLEVITANEDDVASKLTHYGGLFIGSNAAEVLGDYGAGPNHTLPTSGTARYTGGLSVFNFLRIRTWLKIDRPEEYASLFPLFSPL